MTENTVSSKDEYYGYYFRALRSALLSGAALFGLGYALIPLNFKCTCRRTLYRSRGYPRADRQFDALSVKSILGAYIAAFKHCTRRSGASRNAAIFPHYFSAGLSFKVSEVRSRWMRFFGGLDSVYSGV